ncbi:glycosyltransferase family 1 protein [Bacillus sp. AFS055030]|uniref:glycosyltransferase family 1 protein n=1 Tax=Bacillus sp. AFS055030 TaxID=2033507 RepID=UPI000BFD2109|nr:glycosyltransferase family 1 protein [Bacillus sp. AFS055030]PGL70321.1 glycosyl transferase family 1 [Bacillus sp. AFS055030]
MGNPLRVLHSVVNMNRGGAETLIMNLYRNIDRSKVQFDFLTCKEGVFDAEIVAMGGKIHRIPYVTDVGHLGYIRKLDKFFRLNPNYKIVHSHMDKMSGLVLRAAKKANIPVRIAHSHNTKSEGGFASQLYKWYAGKQITPNATHLFACSEAASKWLFSKRTNESLLLKNGIESDKFLFSLQSREKIREELNIAKKSFVVGHIGRFNHQKNHLFLLEIFAGLLKKMPNAVLILVGGGALQTKIEAKIKELEIEKNVKLLGIREDIHLVLQAMDVFVFPSLHEGLPVTLIEAQGASLTCIISDSITKEVDMEIGLVQYCSLSDKERWIEKILEEAQKNYPRKNAESALYQKGYDIRKTAEITQKTYISLGR